MPLAPAPKPEPANNFTQESERRRLEGLGALASAESLAEDRRSFEQRGVSNGLRALAARAAAETAQRAGLLGIRNGLDALAATGRAGLLLIRDTPGPLAEHCPGNGGLV